ncbi:hypothetical protein O988_06283, partial [Pseudogymnoascus sp. VKM F-3808]
MCKISSTPPKSRVYPSSPETFPSIADQRPPPPPPPCPPPTTTQ